MTPRKEPTLGELLADPMIRALMSADHVDPHALEAMFHSLAPRVARPRATALAHWPQPLFVAGAVVSNVSPAAAPTAAKRANAVCGSLCAW